MTKRKCLSIEKTCLIISEIKKPNKKKKDIAEKFGISPITLSTILKNKDFKRLDYEYPDVDDALIKWTTVARHKNNPLYEPIIREKAKEFAESLGHSDFAASVGWLDKFRDDITLSEKSFVVREVI